MVLFCKPACWQSFCHCANLQHSNSSSSAKLAYRGYLSMRLVHHGAICIIHLDNLQPSWAIRNSFKHCKDLVPWRLGRHLVMLLFQWFALVELPSSILNSLSCWLQRERSISLLLWIFHNCEFFLNLWSQLRNHSFSHTSLCSSPLILSNRHRCLLRVCVISAFLFPLCTSYWNTPWILRCNWSIGPSKRMINNAQGVQVRCTYHRGWIHFGRSLARLLRIVVGVIKLKSRK